MMIFSDRKSFDAKLAKADTQFLRCYTLAVLVNSAADKSFTGLEARDVIDNLEKIGFSERTTEEVLRSMIARQFCFSRSHQEYSRETVLIPSHFGGYIVRELLWKFVFLENTMYDTFVGDDVAWEKIRTNMKAIYAERHPVKRFQLRKEAVSVFFGFVSPGSAGALS